MTKLTRRSSFYVGALSALAATRVRGANGRVGFGVIGSGRRGREVAAAFLADSRVQLSSVCDVYNAQRERAVAAWRPADGLHQTDAHEQTLDRKDVDAVLIATPDHLHLALASAALGAGKHVYLEKPVIHRWQEAALLVKSVQGSKRQLQCGTQQRSGAHYHRAKAEVFAKGLLGDVRQVRAVWHDFPWQRRRIAAGAKPEGLNWERFLGPSTKRPYEAARYDAWRYFPDYGGGLLADILTHWIDVAQWMLDDASPVQASALGGIFALDDGRENPDTVNAVVKYKNWSLSFESSVLPLQGQKPGVLFVGTAGTLFLARDGYTLQVGKDPAVEARPEGSLEKAHAANFLDAVVLGAALNAPVNTGIEASKPVQMALAAYWKKSVVTPAELA